VYGPKPTPVPANSTNNITVATPSPLAGPTPVPTPLAPDINRTGHGTSFATLVSLLIGLICVGYIAGIGFMMIKK
jgi:hypothetical protein